MRRVFDAQKAGHAGTLDPLASGVLAVALGEATKTVPFAMDAEKAYRFTARWGEARDSDDAEGRVDGTSEVRPSKAEIEALLPRFIGDISQVPPRFSAVKVDGERAYDLARDGEAPCARTPNRFDPRSPAGEAARPGSCRVRNAYAAKGLMSGPGSEILLSRWVLWAMFPSFGAVSVGGFTLSDAIPLEKLKSFVHSPAAFEHLKPISTALDGIPALAVTGADAVRLRCGNPI